MDKVFAPKTNFGRGFYMRMWLSEDTSLTSQISQKRRLSSETLHWNSFIFNLLQTPPWPYRTLCKHEDTPGDPAVPQPPGTAAQGCPNSSVLFTAQGPVLRGLPAFPRKPSLNPSSPPPHSTVYRRARVGASGALHLRSPKSQGL